MHNTKHNFRRIPIHKSTYTHMQHHARTHIHETQITHTNAHKTTHTTLHTHAHRTHSYITRT
ncbi:hypothetical protein HanIR_Chr01g0026241 [Helianthus annuus]|nr:hypothetical protein HanIR_Chr01g0026241 [Helianthus annuus]